MLKSPWMLLVVVPGGLLLVAAAAAFGPAESAAAGWAFVGLATLAFVVGSAFTFTFARRPSAPSLATLRHFARDWIHAHPRASDVEARAALVRWFGGSNGESELYPATSGNPGDALAEAGIASMAVWLRHRFFPSAPARPEDIDVVLGELRAEGQFKQG